MRWILAACFALGIVACDSTSTPRRNLDSFLNSGYGYLEQGQFRAALIEAENALQLAPGSERAVVLQAKIYLELGTVRRAYQQLEAVEGTTWEYFRTLAEAYIQSRKYASALALIRRKSEQFSQHPFETKVLEARGFLGLRQDDEAEKRIVSLLQTAPDNIEAKLVEADFYALRGDLEAAETRLEEILEKEPDSVEALQRLSIVYVQQDRLELAEDTLTATISALPTTDLYTRQRANVLRVLISLLVRQGRSGEALVYQRMLDEAFPQARENRAKFEEALASLKSRDLDKAEAILSELYETDSSSETGATLLGLINFMQGESAVAQRFFTEVVDPETAPGQLLSSMGMNLLRMNRPEEVVEIFEGRVSTTRDPRILAVYGIAAISADKIEDGVAALQKAIDLYPGNARLRMLLAGHYNTATPPQPETALEVLEEGYEIDPESREMLIGLLDQLLLMGRTERGRSLIESRLASRPDDPDALFVAGAYWRRLGKLDEALASFQRASQLDPDFEQAYVGIANVHMAREEWQVARAALRKVLDANPTNTTAMRGLLETFAAEGKVEEGVKALDQVPEEGRIAAHQVVTEYLAENNLLAEAEEQLEGLQEYVPDSFETRRLIAEVARKRALRARSQGDFAEARAQVFRALSAFPRNRQLLALLALIEIESGQFGEAEKVLKDIERRFSRNALVDELWGELELARNNPGRAVEYYRAAWNAAPTDARGARLLAGLKAQGATEEAETFAVEWTETLPDSVLAVVSRVELRSDDRPRAISIYENARIENPDNPTILNNLAWYYLQEGDLDNALARAHGAYEAAPRSAAVLDTYGWILHKTGEYGQSLALLERARELAPNDADIQDHLDAVRATSQ